MFVSIHRHLVHNPQNWPPERSFDRRAPPRASPEQLQRAVQRFPPWSPLNNTRSCWRLLAPSPDSNSLLPPEWMWRRTLFPPAYRKNLNTSQTGGALIIKSSNHFAQSVQIAEKRECGAGGMTADWGSVSERLAGERVDQSKRSRTTTWF